MSVPLPASVPSPMRYQTSGDKDVISPGVPLLYIVDIFPLVKAESQVASSSTKQSLNPFHLPPPPAHMLNLVAYPLDVSVLVTFAAPLT